MCQPTLKVHSRYSIPSTEVLWKSNPLPLRCRNAGDIHAFIQSTFSHLSVQAIQSSINSSTHSLIHGLIHTLTHSFGHSVTHSSSNSVMYSFVQLFFHHVGEAVVHCQDLGGSPSCRCGYVFFFVHQTLSWDSFSSVFLPEMWFYGAGGPDRCIGASLSSKNSWRMIAFPLGGRVTLFFSPWI